MSTNGTAKRHIGSTSIDTRTLVALMVKVPVGESITYQDLSSAIGRNVQGAARSVLESARHICERDYNIVFGVVQNVGLKHLTDTETINTGQAGIDHIRRTARKTARRIASLKDPNSVPNESKVRQFTYLSVAGALVHMTQQKQITRLEVKVGQAAKELPLAKTLEAFKE